jgi:hypothetical protein
MCFLGSPLNLDPKLAHPLLKRFQGLCAPRKLPGVLQVTCERIYENCRSFIDPDRGGRRIAVVDRDVEGNNPRNVQLVRELYVPEPYVAGHSLISFARNEQTRSEKDRVHQWLGAVQVAMLGLRVIAFRLWPRGRIYRFLHT